MPTAPSPATSTSPRSSLYAFWLFFAGLIFYLRREDKREGYPLDSDRLGGGVVGRASRPCRGRRPSSLPHGGTYRRRAAPGPRELAADAAGPWPGAPLDADRQPDDRRRRPRRLRAARDMPDLTLRRRAAHRADARGPRLRGRGARTATRAACRSSAPTAGRRHRDATSGSTAPSRRSASSRSELAGGRRPSRAAADRPRADRRRERQIRSSSILGHQFADVPRLRTRPVTLLEEDKICGLLRRRHLYASRTGWSRCCDARRQDEPRAAGLPEPLPQGEACCGRAPRLAGLALRACPRPRRWRLLRRPAGLARSPAADGGGPPWPVAAWLRPAARWRAVGCVALSRLADGAHHGLHDHQPARRDAGRHRAADDPQPSVPPIVGAPLRSCTPTAPATSRWR